MTPIQFNIFLFLLIALKSQHIFILVFIVMKRQLNLNALILMTK